MEAEIEVWKEIPDYPNYKVSNLGRVYSKIRNRYLRFGMCRGYCRVSLTNGKTKNIQVHRIVCKVFNGEPPSKEMQVNHIDGVKHHNYPHNLEWVTPKQNTEHAYKLGLKIGQSNMKGKFGKDNPRSTPIEQLTLDGVFIREFDSQATASRELKIDQGFLSKCLHGKAKSAGGFKWRYATKTD